MKGLQNRLTDFMQQEAESSVTFSDLVLIYRFIGLSGIQNGNV